MGCKDGVYTTINNDKDEVLTSKEGSECIPNRKSRTQTTLGKLKHHEPV